MLSRHDKYPINCARVHGAMGADSLSLRASAARFAHQNEQRPAGEITLFDVGCDPAAVGGTVKIARILVLGSLPQEPSGAGQAVGGASVIGHGSSSEGFAHNPNEALGLRFQPGHLAQQLQRRGDGRQQDEGVTPLAWINALVGWARCGERRHLTVAAGATLMLALTATLAMGA